MFFKGGQKWTKIKRVMEKPFLDEFYRGGVCFILEKLTSADIF